MKTEIKITLNGFITEEKLYELLGDIQAQLSEDSEGSAWCDKIEIELNGNKLD